MQKPLALSIAACLGLAGCNVFQKSETWNQATKVRPGETATDPDPSHAYASKLHAALAERGIEHKVVVYQYRYTTRLREEAVGTRTAVIYRDNSKPNYPWWLKDDRLNNPFWLPNGSLDKQISFYVRRHAEGIETKDYPAQGGSGKAVAFAKPAPALRPAAAPQSEVAVTRIIPVKTASVTAVTKRPAPVTAIVNAFALFKAPVVKAREAKAPVVAKAPAPAAKTTAVVKAPVAKAVPTPKAPAIIKAPVIAKAPEAPKAAVVAKGPEAAKPAPQEPTANASVAKVKVPILFSSIQPEPEATTPAPAASTQITGNTPVWSPPSVLDAGQQSSLTAPRDERLEKLFRARHGTEYNRFSPTDRRKMQQLQNGVASRE